MIRRLVVVAVSLATLGFGALVAPVPVNAMVDSANVVPSPNPSSVSNGLQSVSCVSTSWCVSVGYIDNGDFSQTLTLIWDGVEWSTAPSPNLGGGDNFLDSVSCVSVSWCTAVGYYYDGPSTQAKTLVLMWDGNAWAEMSSPSPGIENDLLNSVSCVSESFCMATGFSSDSDSAETLTLVWDGAAWTTVSSPNAGIASDVLTEVSCLSPSWCIAVGNFESGPSSQTQTLALAWDGRAWSIMPSLSPGTFGNVLNSISCISALSCTAVGYYYDVSSTGTSVLVQRWDGSSWSVVPSPNGDAASNFLESVSCLGASSCTAVGYSLTNLLAQTLVLTWDGAEWSIVPSPNADNDNNELLSVACVSAKGCTAVGISFTGSLARTLVLALTESSSVTPTFTG